MEGKTYEKMIKRDKAIIINSLHFQTNIIYKDVEKNIARTKISLQNYSKEDKLDIVLFPEMAFTGYNFNDVEDVRPFLEQQQKGKTFEFLSEVAKNLNSYVLGGYPELYINDKNQEEYYNSAYLIDRTGKLIQNIRKKHLYATDKTWAQEGQEFKSITLVNSEGVEFKTSVGICMDINCYEFLDNSAFEWAEFMKKEEVDVVLFIQNWTDSEPNRDDGASIKALVDYFIWRLRPLVNAVREIRYPKSWLFLTSNRVGKEQNALYNRGNDYYSKDKEIVFAGSSVAIKLNPEELVYNLDKRQEGILKCQATLE